MKTVIKILEFLKGLKDNKFFKNYLAFVLTIFLGFSMFTAYAQNATSNSTDSIPSVSLNTAKGYAEDNKFTQIITGDTGSTVQTTSVATLRSVLEVGVGFMDPDLSDKAAEIHASDLSSFTKNGLIGSIGNATSSLYANLPAVNLPRYLAQEWVPNYNQGNGSVYAANDGYTFLIGIGIDGLWEKTRMIAYVLFVVVLLVAGFMIMFRQKIGGQVAVSLFNALPNVIVGLILVTFSFAIVGLFLNFAVMLVNVVGTFLSPNATGLISVNNPFSLMSILFSGEYWKQIASQTAIGLSATGVIGVIVGAIVAATSTTVATGGMAGVVIGGMVAGAGIALLLIILILCAVVAYASIRVYITILTAYLGIILDTIVGPLYLAIASIPGNQEIRNDWFKRLLKNSLVFPLTFFFINLGMFILKNNVNISFPHGLTSGNFAAADTSQGAIGWLLRGFIVIILFFFAADSPKMLDDFIQIKGGKGAAEAVAGMKKGLTKIPLIGGMFA